MEHRPLSLVARLTTLLLAACSALALAGEPSAEQEADWRQRSDKAAAMQAEAKAMQDEADRIFEEKTPLCFKKFLVNACRDNVRKEHTAASREASRLENQGKAMSREVRKEQLEDKDRRRAEAAPVREAEQAERLAETAAESKAAEEKAAATQAQKAQKAEAGAKRKAAEEEQQRKKQADHDARVAAKMQEAERKAAEAAEKK